MKIIYRFSLAVLLVCMINIAPSIAQWVKTNGLPSEYIYSLAVNDPDLYVGGDYMGLFVSTDNGTNWAEIDSGLGKVNIKAIAFDSTNIFVGADYVGVYTSTDKGKSWIGADSGLVNLNIRAMCVIGGNIFLGNGDGVAISTNQGKTWTQVNSGLTNTYVQSLAASANGLFAGTGIWGRVFLSTNNGTTWTEVDSGLSNPTTISFVTSFAMMETNIIAGTEVAGVFLSTNDGSTWIKIDSGIINDPHKSNLWVSSIVVYGSDIFAGTNAGVYLSTDKGRSWVDVSLGLALGPTTPLSVLVISKNELIAGTSGHGVWRRPLSEMITALKGEDKNIPLRFVLQQNFPNPFNPITTIGYTVSGLGATHVRLAVYDQLGREVAVPVNENREPGSYQLHFDGSALSSGVYCYRIQAGSFIQSKKMLLLK